MNPRHPIYIVSKNRPDLGRHTSTSRALTELGVPHSIVVEADQREQYAAAASPLVSLLTLDPAYQRDYDPCDDLGDTKSKGPGAARNFAWDHALASGAPWHWVMDDNIAGFWVYNDNRRVPAADGTPIRLMEAFCARYENVLMAGPNYYMFTSRKSKFPPFVLNTRIYSCNLIRNDAPYRWRGRYNEDTDLCLRMLKDGWVTVQFNAYLQWKMSTQTVAGGNTDEFYAKEGTLPKSRMQVALHPDVSRLVWRFGRWHHFVDYSPFAGNRLRRKPGFSDLEGHGLGLRLETFDGERWVAADG